MDLTALLGDEAEALLTYKPKISKEAMALPGPDFIDRVLPQRSVPSGTSQLAVLV